MRKWFVKYKVFILTLIAGGILFFPSFYIIVSDISGKYYNYITPIGEAIWIVLCAPFGFVFNYLVDSNNGTFIGVFIDIILYSLLFQLLWNKYKKRKGTPTKPKS